MKKTCLLICLALVVSCGGSSETTPTTTTEPTTTTVTPAVNTTTPTTTTTTTPTTTTQITEVPTSNDAKIDLINFSATPTSDLMSWVDFASNKMAERTANILIVAYNIGEYLGGEIPGMPFNSNEIVLSQSQIDLLIAQIEEWMLNDPCMGRNEERGHLNEELELSLIHI